MATACGKASRKKPRDAQRDVDTRAAQFGERDRLQAGDPPRGVVPHRADAEQRERLGDVVARGAHRAGAPQRQARPRWASRRRVGAVARQQGVGERLAGLPGEPGGDGLGVDGVEVAAGRQHVDQAAQRRAGGPGAGRSRRSGRARRGRSRRWWRPAAARPRGRRRSRMSARRAWAVCSVPARPPPPPDRRRVPVRVLHRLDQGAGLGPRRCVRGRCGWRRTRPGRAPRAGPGRACAPPQICRARRMASTRLTRSVPVGAAPRTCRPSRIWASLISHSQPSTCRMKSSKPSSSGRSSRPRSWSSLAAWMQRPDLGADGGQLGRVHGGDLGVLVEQLLQAGDVAVATRRGPSAARGGRQRGVRAALGLGALARVVDQERVDQRQVAQRGVRCAGRGQPGVLARQPLQVAVLAEVDHGVRAEAAVRSGGAASQR